MGPTIFTEVYALYMTSHLRFMTSQHSIQFICLLYIISNWIYLTTHPLHLCIHTQIIDHKTPIVCMITQAQNAWHHVNTYDITSTLYDITPRYDLHTHSIHLITLRIPVVTSTAADLLLTAYWVYHISNMCDLKPTICVASHEFYVTSQQLIKTSQDCIHDITPTVYDITYTLLLTSQPCNYEKTPAMFLTLYSVYMTSHMLNKWQRHVCISHDTECICVIKPTWLMTSHLMYVWNHTRCTHDTIGPLYGITSTLADSTTLFACHGTHSVYDITCIIYDV